MEKLIYIDRSNLNKNKSIGVLMLLCGLTAIAEIWTIVSTFNIATSVSEIFSGGIVDGFKYFWNKVTEALLISDGMVFKGLSGAASSCGAFLLLLMLIFWIILAVIFKSKNKYLLFVIFLAPLLIIIFTSLEPSVNSFLFLILMAIMDFVFMTRHKKVSLLNGIFVGSLILIILVAMASPMSAKIFSKPQSLVMLDEKIEQFREEIKYGKSPLGAGNLEIEKRSVDKNKTTLEITMTKPQSIYLRGYIGEVYKGNSWENLPYGEYRESKNLIYWLGRNGFNGIGQITQIDELVSSKSIENKITVNVKEGYKKYAYIPYEIKKYEKRQINWYNGYLTSDKRDKLDEYTYISGPNSVKKWTELSAKFFTKMKNDKDETYLKNESYFNEFVYDNYTYLSNNDYKLLKNYIGDKGNQSKGHIEYKRAIKKVRKYLDDKILYTENPRLVKDNKKVNILERFFETNKGYDVHYATAATLMFRYYGIPARYVEGYLVTPTDVKNAKAGETIKIPEKNIHSWTEIYIDGIGFVPIEVTPNYRNIMQEADMKIGLENESINKKFDHSKNNIKKQKAVKKSKVMSPRKVQIALIVSFIFLALLMLLLIYLACKIVKKGLIVFKRERLFKKGDSKIAVAAILGYMDEKGYEVPNNMRMIGNKGAYSNEPITEEERKEMYDQFKMIKKETRSHGGKFKMDKK